MVPCSAIRSSCSAGEESIGIWRKAAFETWFVEATPQYPTISNRLRWNGGNMIVITHTSDLNSYLVPRPGIRLNLADLTDTPADMDDDGQHQQTGRHGRLGGAQPYNIEETFLLRRLPESPGADSRLEAARASTACRLSGPAGGPRRAPGSYRGLAVGGLAERQHK